MAVKPKKDTFHGGFVRDRGEGRGVRVSNTKPQDLARVDLSAPVSPIDASKGAQARRTKLAVMGLSADLLDAGDPRYAACVRLANSFRKARTKEMYESHGHVSSGVSALLASSAMALASARFLYEVAASADPRERVGILKNASQLSDSSRQNELSAWELCSRESQVKKRNDAANVSSPWLIGPSGGEKRKPGRPRKVETPTELLCLLNSPDADNSRETDSSSEGSYSGEGETIDMASE